MVTLKNAGDVQAMLQGKIKPEEVHSCEIEAVIDTGAVNSVIPREIAEKLELAVLKKQRAKYANAFTEEVDIAPQAARAGRKRIHRHGQRARRRAVG